MAAQLLGLSTEQVARTKPSTTVAAAGEARVFLI